MPFKNTEKNALEVTFASWKDTVTHTQTALTFDRICIFLNRNHDRKEDETSFNISPTLFFHKIFVNTSPPAPLIDIKQ